VLVPGDAYLSTTVADSQTQLIWKARSIDFYSNKRPLIATENYAIERSLIMAFDWCKSIFPNLKLLFLSAKKMAGAYIN
jgi:hypothetical protein